VYYWYLLVKETSLLSLNITGDEFTILFNQRELKKNLY